LYVISQDGTDGVGVGVGVLVAGIGVGVFVTTLVGAGVGVGVGVPLLVFGTIFSPPENCIPIVLYK
jgi:hypothetical protein